MGEAFPCSVTSWGCCCWRGLSPSWGCILLGLITKSLRGDSSAGREKGRCWETFKEHSSHARPATRRAPDALTA